jgi:hypothetical protein
MTLALPLTGGGTPYAALQWTGAHPTGQQQHMTANNSTFVHSFIHLFIHVTPVAEYTTVNNSTVMKQLIAGNKLMAEDSGRFLA